MHARGFWQPGGVSDETLMQGLRELLSAEGRNEARIVAHLAEVDARRLHLKGAESLFEYCQKRLGLSDCHAYYRIAAARVARRFPVVFGLIERRELHLTNIAPLAKHLTSENHLELLAEAGRLSKRELLCALARRYPKPASKSTIRPLSRRELAAVSIEARRLLPGSGEFSAGPTGSLEPLSAELYRLRLNLTHEHWEKLMLARDLMSHANPSGDLAEVVARGLDLLITRLKGRRFGLTAQPRRENGKANEKSGVKVAAKTTTEAHAEAESHAEAEARPDAKDLASALANVAESAHRFDRSKSATSTRRRSRDERRAHVPHETRRAVVARDGLRCNYVASDGTRCSARAFLELDHEHAWARGGDDTAANLRMTCRAHNRLTAETVFGADHVANAIARERGG